jgi:SAM-dependent methyltransferase
VLAPFGPVTGCDRSELAVRFCEQRGLRDVARADLNTADLGRERYDVITCVDVLYHRDIGDELAVLRRLYGALRPGGLLVLQVPAFPALRSTHDDAVLTRRRYTRTEVSGLLEDAGFLVERSSYRVAALFPAIAVLRVAKRFVAAGDGAATRSDTRLPGTFVNKMLLGIMRLENSVLRRARLPFGTSVIAAARRPEGGA